MKHTLLDLIGMPLVPSPVFCGDGGGGGGGDDGGSDDSGGGYTSIGDMFDGGGPGASGDSFSSVDNTGLDTDGDGHISSSEAVAGTGSANLSGGIDGSSTSNPFFGGDDSSSSETALINSDLSDDDFWNEFESGTSSMDTSTGNVSSGGGGIFGTSSGGNTTPGSFYGASSSTDNVVSSGSSSSNIGADDAVQNMDWSDATGCGAPSNDGGSDSGSGTGTDAGTSSTDLNQDLLDEINRLQQQIDGLSGGGGTTIVYEGSGDTETALPADYLTEADLARYFDNLDLGSNAYDPAAFLNAYGFALDPAAYGGIIPTFANTNGVYVRRAVKDKDTGEIRYVNVPIGAGATMGNDGLSMFRNERRTGFGNFV
jgi:hypothetical protein